MVGGWFGGCHWRPGKGSSSSSSAAASPQEEEEEEEEEEEGGKGEKEATQDNLYPGRHKKRPPLGDKRGKREVIFLPHKPTIYA